MNKSKVFLDFIRIRQYYKNIIVFLPLVFTIQLFSSANFLTTLIGFIALCLVSSSIYIRNDIWDVEVDKIHPVKSKRALPAGFFTIKQARVFFILFITIGFSLSIILDWRFTIMLLLLFLNTEIYSRWTKNVVFLDAFSIAGNFIIRAISGIILIHSPMSPWVILGIFFVALFLGYVKRKAESESLNENAINHRRTLGEYTPFSLNSVVTISAMMVIITYSLYAMDGPNNDWRLILTVPMVIFVIFRQIHLSSINDPIAQTNEIFRDKQSAVAIFAFLILVIYLIYFAPSEFFTYYKL